MMGWFSKKDKRTPKCSNCEFCTSYQMLNNRDQRIDVNYCSMLSGRTKSVNNNFIDRVSISIDDPDNFSCSLHKFKPAKNK